MYHEIDFTNTENDFTKLKTFSNNMKSFSTINGSTALPLGDRYAKETYERPRTAVREALAAVPNLDGHPRPDGRHQCRYAAEDAQRAAAAAAPAAEQVAPADAGKITEVFVTATKRSTSLQKTPVAVTALNAAALDDNHVQTIQDVVNLVPGFAATGQGDHGVITMTMRGIGNDSAKTEYADPEVASFVDGVYSPRPEGATALLFDLDAIEVLRGPQGTLWGRNSTVGAVNMQTVKPEIGSNAGNFELGYGNYTGSARAARSTSRSAAPWPRAWPWCTSSMTATSTTRRR
jgi:outer membrane receptor for monomeric catechols